MIIAILRRKMIAFIGFALFGLAVLTAGFALVIKLQKNVIFDRAQGFIEANLRKALNAKVSIASFDAGLVGPVVLNGLRLTKDAGSGAQFIFESRKVTIYCNTAAIFTGWLFKKRDNDPLKQFAFRIENGSLRRGENLLLRNLSGYGKIINNNLIFTDITGRILDFPLSVHGEVSGGAAGSSSLDLNIRSVSDNFGCKVSLSGDLRKPRAVGTAELANGYKMYFCGDLDFLKKRLWVKFIKPRGIELTADFSKQDVFDISVLLGHFAVGRFDIRSQVNIELAKEGRRLNGRLSTSGTVLNCSPLDEFDGEFFVEDGLLRLASLKWGDDYKLAGSLNLSKPYETDLALDIKPSNLNQLFLVSDLESQNRFSGRISGKVKVSGPVLNLLTVANLQCSKGNLGSLDYESMNVNLSGRGPVLKVLDSRILRREGYIQMAGAVDLRQLWLQQPCKGLEWACGNEAVIWEGWDIVKEAKSQELQMKKGVGNNKEFKVTFKSYLNDEQSWQDAERGNQNEAVGVEYNLDAAKKVKMQIKNNEEVVSLENKVRF